MTSALIGESEPDVLLVHNPVQARPALGRVPVVAAGHLHRSELELLEGTTLTVVGSSGAEPASATCSRTSRSPISSSCCASSTGSWSRSIASSCRTQAATFAWNGT